MSESSHQIIFLTGLQKTAHAAHKRLGSVSQNCVSANQQISCPVGWMAVPTAVMNHLHKEGGGD